MCWIIPFWLFLKTSGCCRGGRILAKRLPCKPSPNHGCHQIPGWVPANTVISVCWALASRDSLRVFLTSASFTHCFQIIGLVFQCLLVAHGSNSFKQGNASQKKSLASAFTGQGFVGLPTAILHLHHRCASCRNQATGPCLPTTPCYFRYRNIPAGPGHPACG